MNYILKIKDYYLFIYSPVISHIPISPKHRHNILTPIISPFHYFNRPQDSEIE